MITLLSLPNPGQIGYVVSPEGPENTMHFLDTDYLVSVASRTGLSGCALRFGLLRNHAMLIEQGMGTRTFCVLKNHFFNRKPTCPIFNLNI
jgi:hypothetical protein